MHHSCKFKNSLCVFIHTFLLPYRLCIRPYFQEMFDISQIPLIKINHFFNGNCCYFRFFVFHCILPPDFF